MLAHIDWSVILVGGLALWAVGAVLIGGLAARIVGPRTLAAVAPPAVWVFLAGIVAAGDLTRGAGGRYARDAAHGARQRQLLAKSTVADRDVAAGDAGLGASLVERAAADGDLAARLVERVRYGRGR